MPRMPRLPCALAIGGVDPGAGAGVMADLRAFAAAGAFGCAAVAVLTVQSTAGLRSVEAIAPAEVTAQALEVLVHQQVRAIKLGALGSAANVRAVGRLLARFGEIPSVVDTPMRPTKGRARLLAREALAALREELLPRATLLTVNTDEAEALLGRPVTTVREARDAAQALLERGPRAVIVKGGHLAGTHSTDVLAVESEVLELRARRLGGGPFHGSGCTFASLVAGRMATRAGERLGREALVDAVLWAKRVHRAALGRAASVGEGSRVLVFEPGGRA
jgi:hydroxymethylpyrimidine/phosphomethylpyrimidine kinase